MKKMISAFMALVGITMFVSCSSPADDGVGLPPMSNTDSTFYFDTGSHTVSIEEGQERTINIERISDAFTIQENSNGGISVTKANNPNRITIAANDVNTNPGYEVKITDQGVTATLKVLVTERDRGWRNGVFTIENIDGDRTEQNSTGYVEIEAQGYTNYDPSTLEPASARNRIEVLPLGDKIRVIARNHYDESTPITFKIRKDSLERTVKVNRVTKFWLILGTTVLGLSDANFVTENSFDKVQDPPKVPYNATTFDGYYFREYDYSNHSPSVGYSYKRTDEKAIWQNTKIKKIDLNNVTEVTGRSFYNCTNLEKVIANKVERLGAQAFWGTKITRIELPAIKQMNISVAVYSNSRETGFIFPQTIKTITLGKNLTHVGKDTFSRTDALTDLRIEVSTPSQLKPSYGLFESNIIAQPSSARVLVPQASVADWNTNFPWLATQFTGGVRGYN